MKKRFKGLASILVIVLIFSSPVTAFADYGDIIIDGYYDDWEDKPHTEVYQGNNPKDKMINQVSLFRDDANIYVHIIFSDQYSSGIKNMRVELTTNLGDGYYELEESSSYSMFEDIGIEAIPVRTEMIIDVIELDNENEDPGDEGDENEASGDENEALSGDHDDEDETIDDEDEVLDEEEGDREPIFTPSQSGSAVQAFNVYEGNNSVGGGYLTTVNRRTVEAEFYIPLSTITTQPDGITEISMQIKKLGHQWIHSVGAGTNPYTTIIISLGVGFLVAQVLKRSRAKRNAK